MEKELYEQASKVDAKKLSDILNEQEECPFNKTLLEIYGLSTPTSEILDYIHDHKLSLLYLIFGLFMEISCIVPLFIFDFVFGTEIFGLMLMFGMILLGVFAFIKSATIARPSKHILNDLEMNDDDYSMVLDTYEKYKKQQPTFITLGIALMVFSIFPVIFTETFFYSYLAEGLGVATMFLMISSGIGTVVYQFLNKNIYHRLLQANRSIYE